MEYNCITFDRYGTNDQIGRITLNRPEKINAATKTMPIARIQVKRGGVNRAIISSEASLQTNKTCGALRYRG